MKSNFYTRIASKLFFQASFIFAFLLMTSSSVIAQNETCTSSWIRMGPHKIKFVGVEYDYPNPGESTWFYKVKASCYKNVDEVTIPLNLDCANVIDAGVWRGCGSTKLRSGRGNPEVGYDDHAHVTGVMFKKKIKKRKGKRYYFTLDKNVDVAPVADVSIRSACKVYQSVVCAPTEICEEEKPCATCITGSAFRDANINGTWDADESTISNVAVNLFSVEGTTITLVSTQATDDLGNYNFCELAPGTYFINMAASADYMTTFQNLGDPNFDSDIDTKKGNTGLLEIVEECSSLEFIDGGFFLEGDGGFQNFSTNNSTTGDINTNSRHNTGNGNTTYVDNLKSNSNLITEKPNFQQKTDIEIFPSLFRDQVTVRANKEFDKEIKVEIRAQDMTLIRTTTIQANQLEKRFDLSRLSPGIYFAVYIYSNGVSSIQKIVKM